MEMVRCIGAQSTAQMLADAVLLAPELGRWLPNVGISGLRWGMCDYQGGVPETRHREHGSGIG